MELYKRVKQLSKRVAGSEAKLAAILGLRQNQFNGYLNPVSQRNLWEHLPAILTAFPDVRRDWLFFGEGEMLKSDTPAKETAPATPEAVMPPIFERSLPPQQYTQPVPLIGFAACSAIGWHGTMTIPVPVEPPTWFPGMFAVMASGESMLPAGIGHGHICYCDATKTPGIDEAVYVETTDNQGTIKLFCGWSERSGKVVLNLRGWWDKKEDTGQQEPMFLHVPDTVVRKIAPVVYVRRRL